MVAALSGCRSSGNIETYRRPPSARMRVLLRVSPENLVKAGLTCYRRQRYDDAITCFQAAIERARQPDIAGDWTRRLVVDGEPMAWYLMGNSYFRRGDMLEAQQAYEACLETFWGDRGDAIPAKFRDSNAGLVEQLKVRVLSPCANNGRIAATVERGARPGKFNAMRMDAWLDWIVRLDGEPVGRFGYPHTWYEAAVAASEDARALLRDGREREAHARLLEAVRLFGKAETQFLETKSESPFREESLYWAGISCYQALSALPREDRADDRASDMATRARSHFEAYRQFVRDNPPKPRSTDPAAAEVERREIEERRIRRLRTIDLTGPFIRLEEHSWEEVLRTGQELAARKDLDAGQLEGVHALLFRCRLSLSQERERPGDTEAHLVAAEQDVRWFEAQLAKSETDERMRLRAVRDGLVRRLCVELERAIDRAEEDPEVAKRLRAMLDKWRKTLQELPGIPDPPSPPMAANKVAQK